MHTKAWIMIEPLAFAFDCRYHHFYRIPKSLGSEVSWIRSSSPIQAQTAHYSYTLPWLGSSGAAGPGLIQQQHLGSCGGARDAPALAKIIGKYTYFTCCIHHPAADQRSSITTRE